MSDTRFNALSSDPRYRLPSRKEARTAIDPRFKFLLTDQEFRKKASVDRYGRKVKPDAGKKDLKRLYRLEKEEKPTSMLKKKFEREVVGSSEESEQEEEDGSEEEDLVKERDPAREGFSGSESSEEETSDEEEESDAEVELAELTAGHEQTEDIPMGDVTRRIACVNLDWDNIRAADIMAVALSFVPNGGKVQNVTIYPSEFGRERLEREEMEGPPREIFASSSRKSHPEDDDGESTDDEDKIKERLLKQQASEGEEFDTAKLRQYQLDRLRYYYAVVECDSLDTAKTLYDSMDGREYLSTSNFFDLRFIPEETSFDEDKPHDECNELPRGYKPNDFKTEALTHSKVRLTWDADDATRKEVQKRAFSRAEMDENDLQAYIGSDDSDADSTTSRKSAAEDKKAKKKEEQRAKMRAALGLPAENIKSNTKDKEGPIGDMQITFTSGLTGSGKGGKGVFENEPQDEESTRARYIRKEKERKQKRKEKMKAGRHGADIEGAEESPDDAAAPEDPDEDDPFNDPFFNDPEAARKQEKAAKKAARQAKVDAKNAANAEAEARRGELELLMAEEDADLRHFDMREIEKAQKEAKRAKHNKKKSKKEAENVEDNFKVETEDPRFSKLFDSHEYAIDPTNPRFKKTEGMKTLLEEGRKKRKVTDDDNDTATRKGKKIKSADDEDVKGLVARLKSKSKNE